MKTVFAILMSVFMAFLLGCEKDTFLPPQEETSPTAEFRDVPTEPQGPAWKAAIWRINGYITKMADDVLDARFAKVLMNQSSVIEKALLKHDMQDAREQVRIFDGKVEVMVEKAYLPERHAKTLLGMTATLREIINGKLVLFREDFESYEPGVFPYRSGWQLQRIGQGERFQFVTNELAFSGAKSLKLEGNPGWPAVAYMPMAERPKVVFAEASVFLKKPQPGALSCPKAAFGFGHITEDYICKHEHHAFVYFDTNGFIYFGNPSAKSEKLMAWQGNTWYTIRIRYDAAFERGSIWINSELMLDGFSLKGQEGRYTGLMLDSGSNSHTMTYFDDVSVWEPTE